MGVGGWVWVGGWERGPSLNSLMKMHVIANLLIPLVELKIPRCPFHCFSLKLLTPYSRLPRIDETVLDNLSARVFPIFSNCDIIMYCVERKVSEFYSGF